MRKLLAALTLALITAAATAYATTLLCSADRMSLSVTGKTKVESGVRLYQHTCPNRHNLWLTEEQMNR